MTYIPFQSLSFPTLPFPPAQSLSLESAIHLDREAAQRTDAGTVDIIIMTCLHCTIHVIMLLTLTIDFIFQHNNT